LPNYKHVPIAYHGCVSSIVVSGTPVRRPLGQLGEGQFGATKELDYEIELGAFLGPGNKLGDPIPIQEAEHHLAGVCLLNDWSARDIQRWEYQPLGPFLAKSFATSLSPWMVTVEALEPFRAAAPAHDVPVLPYLQAPEPGAFDIMLDVWLRAAGTAKPERVSTASFKEMYWTLAQMIAHHASNGCRLRAGDLIGSGTVSGPAKENRGCLLELNAVGRRRGYLEDGAEVIFQAHCSRQAFRGIGFGECRGIVLPAKIGV
jgi:fumarylacetoacetase